MKAISVNRLARLIQDKSGYRINLDDAEFIAIELIRLGYVKRLPINKMKVVHCKCKGVVK